MLYLDLADPYLVNPYLVNPYRVNSYRINSYVADPVVRYTHKKEEPKSTEKSCWNARTVFVAAGVVALAVAAIYHKEMIQCLATRNSYSLGSFALCVASREQAIQKSCDQVKAAAEQVCQVTPNVGYCPKISDMGSHCKNFFEEVREHNWLVECLTKHSSEACTAIIDSRKLQNSMAYTLSKQLSSVESFLYNWLSKNMGGWFGVSA